MSRLYKVMRVALVVAVVALVIFIGFLAYDNSALTIKVKEAEKQLQTEVAKTKAIEAERAGSELSQARHTIAELQKRIDLRGSQTPSSTSGSTSSSSSVITVEPKSGSSVVAEATKAVDPEVNAAIAQELKKELIRLNRSIEDDLDGIKTCTRIANTAPADAFKRQAESDIKMLARRIEDSKEKIKETKAKLERISQK